MKPVLEKNSVGNFFNQLTLLNSSLSTSSRNVISYATFGLRVM